MYKQLVTLELYDKSILEIFVEKEFLLHPGNISFDAVLAFRGEMKGADKNKTTHLYLRWSDVKVIKVTEL